MAAGNGEQSHRRRSIAVTNQNRPKIAAGLGKRRAHSIVPGDRSSPLARARRSLVPRKSILKTSTILNTEETPDPQSSQPQSQSQSLVFDDGNVTQSMDMTIDYHARVHDNTTRKSFGRRVSFAEHAQVRLFQIPDSNHTNSTGSPQSSPMQPSPEMHQPPTLSNENDYPASAARNRRRSSVRYSIAGSEDMNMTSVNLAAFLPNGSGDEAALLDEEMDLEGTADDMDVTDVIRGDFSSRRSVSLGGDRQPLAPVHAFTSPGLPMDDELPPSDEDLSRSTIEDHSQIHSEGDISNGMEFTVPMGQSLRPPPDEDPVWLALRQVTHSGDTPHEPELSSDDDIPVDHGQNGADLNLNDAMARLMRARDSQIGPNSDDTTEDIDFTTPNVNAAIQDDSLLSTDDSLADDLGTGNETLNISKVIGRISLGNETRMSLGHQDSTMDESDIYGSIVPLSSSTPRPPLAPTAESEENRGTVLSKDSQSLNKPVNMVHAQTSERINPDLTPSPSNAVEQPLQQTTLPSIPPMRHPQSQKTAAVFTKPASPIKPKPKPSFSAAFAPPVAKPSPKKPSAPSTPSQMTPSKRPFSVMQGDANDDNARPSPAKRQALGSKVPSSGSPRKFPTQTQPRTSMSPIKKVTSGSSTNEPSSSNTKAVKRPSGYFARRKSLGMGLTSTQSQNREGSVESRTASPTKTPRTGRVSMGSAPADAWKHFDREASAPSLPYKLAPVTEDESQHAALQPIIASPTPTPAASAPVSPGGLVAGPLMQTTDSENTFAGLDLAETGAKVLEDVMSKGSDQENQVGEDVPTVSIEQFFSITGIKFMDELIAPRRSIHAQNSARQSRNPADIPLAEYYIAMGIDVPQLGLFTRVSKDLQSWMDRSKADFIQAEEEAAKITPELFVEFMRADEEGQAELLHQLNLIRSNVRGHARSDWYDWKLKWIEGLHNTAEQTFDDLQNDAKIIEPIKRSVEELVPILEKEYNEILKELEHEQAEVAEIEASDQEYLNELKSSIAEQNIEIEALRAELSENNEQLDYLRGRLEEFESQKKEAQEAITKAERILQIQKNSTRTEVFRLRDELETLEDLHRCRIVRVDENVFEYEYASHYQVFIPCRNYLPITTGVDIKRVGNAWALVKDDFPRLSNLFLRVARTMVHQDNIRSCREVVHRLADYWSSCSQLRSQFLLLTVKYPVDILPIEPTTGDLVGFKAKTKVMIPSKKAKIFVSFNFFPEIFSRWPLSINSLTCDVDVAYGSVDGATILQAVTGRLRQATPSDNYACLLDACIEAQEIYND